MSRKKPDTRRLRTKGVAAVGPRIGRAATQSRLIVEDGKRATKQKKQRVYASVEDVPTEIRSQVADIRKKYRNWPGSQKLKLTLAASRIIAACGKDKATVNLVMATMLHKPMHQELKDIIRKQMQASI